VSDRAPWFLLLGAVAVLPPAQADDAARRNVIEQKTALVQKVLSDSPVVQRVRASGNDEAVHALANAMANYLQAIALAREGRLGASEAAINDAMALIGRARQLVPDAATRLAEQRVRHAQLLESTVGMLASARRHMERGTAGGDDAERVRGDLLRATDLVASARQFAAGERFDEANRALAAAEQAVLSALGRALGSATLDYTPRFESPAEEYRYEAERFASFRQLVPRALQELRPAAAAVRQTESYLAQGLQLREQAEQQSARGDAGAALRTIREATGWLSRALAAAGLVVQAQ
jgi:hypothetical protein